MAQVVILGAGLTGLSTAYHLEQQGITDFKIYEKERMVGGLCRSVEHDGFTFDYTGHLLHSNDNYFSTFLKQVVGLDAFNIIKRRSFIYSKGVYTHFPFQSNLYGLPHDVITECIEAFVKRPTKIKKRESFYDWALRMFGAGIVKHFFVPYQEKIFAYESKKISASWTGRFVPQTDLKTMITGALQPQGCTDQGYNAQFLYPKKGGINSWITKLADKIITPIATQYEVESIDIKNKIITFKNGDFESYDLLVTTIPLDVFLKLAQESSSQDIKKASKKLLCNAVVNFNLGIQKTDVSDKHWVYLPEKEFPHYRIGFYHNFSDTMAPPGCSSVYGEYAYLKQNEQHIKNNVADAIRKTKTLLGVSDAQVIAQRMMFISHAYVIFDFWRERHLPEIHTQLVQQNIHSIGRYGAWKYASMQESVLDGKVMAEYIQEHIYGTVQKQESTYHRRSRIHRVTPG